MMQHIDGIVVFLIYSIQARIEKKGLLKNVCCKHLLSSCTVCSEMMMSFGSDSELILFGCATVCVSGKDGSLVGLTVIVYQ